MPEIPQLPADIPSKYNDLLRRVAALETANALKSATISSGGLQVANGGSLIINGGTFQLIDTNGALLFSIGPQQYGDEGLSVYRQGTGTLALTVKKVFGSGDPDQRIQMVDRSGQVIAGDAALGVAGFDAPHIPVVWQPVDRSDAKTTTSATFVSLFKARGVNGNPGLPIQLSVLCSDATTAGELQVIDVATGNPLAAFFSSPWVGTIPAGTTTETIITAPSLILPGTTNAAFEVRVQARRTAGTGTVSVSIAGSVGGGL